MQTPKLLKLFCNFLAIHEAAEIKICLSHDALEGVGAGGEIVPNPTNDTPKNYETL